MLRVDLKGKVEDMIPQTLKSIIQQNYLSSVGDEVTLERLTPLRLIVPTPRPRRLPGLWTTPWTPL